jgi:putative spermidine/putrescine transport system ATP-binding protein
MHRIDEMQEQSLRAPGLAAAQLSASTAAKISSPKLSVRGICKYYDETVALDRIDLDVADGEFLTLLGPSGSGKTTLLQAICGLTQPTWGQLLIDGEDRTHAPPNKRDIGVVFQNYALFPHLSVAENIAFPLKVKGVKASDIEVKVSRALDMVNLSHTKNRYPTELSGGQQQRIALARCLVYDPTIILMDEPLGALDRKLREDMQREIKRIHREVGTTIVFVTHDQEEALALSDRICLMCDGRIAQIGTPREMYESPKSAFVADFIGISTIFEGRAENGWLNTEDGLLPLPHGTPDAPTGYLVLRPEMLSLTTEGRINAQVIETVYAGSQARVIAKTRAGKEVTLRHVGNDMPEIGSWIAISWDAEAAVFLTRKV